MVKGMAGIARIWKQTNYSEWNKVEMIGTKGFDDYDDDKISRDNWLLMMSILYSQILKDVKNKHLNSLYIIA